MKIRNLVVVVTVFVFVAVAAWVSLSSEVQAADGGEISGVVTSSNGAEEGVWVIAETNDLATRFIKSVVTGDGGRFLIPELPVATYKVWVRGYGLVDSEKVEAF